VRALPYNAGMAEPAAICGVLLAGGSGSRLLPLTQGINKHLLEVAGEPMIYHAVRKLVSAGVTDILVVTGAEHSGQVVEALGAGVAFGCRITYRVQREAGGIAQALGLAEGFCSGRAMAVLLGDNLFEDELQGYLHDYLAQGGGARVLLKEVPDPERFGVACFDGEQLLRIDEKPVSPASSRVVTGIYFYDSAVFDIIRTLRPSARGELEISDVNNAYLLRGRLCWSELAGWWTDAGTLLTLERAHLLLSGPGIRR